MSQQGDPKEVGPASPLWHREAAHLLQHHLQLWVSGMGTAGLQLQHLRDELGVHKGKREMLGVHCTLHHEWINLAWLLFFPQCHISPTQEAENACPLLPLPGTNPKDCVLLPSLHSSKSFCGINFSLTDACEVWERACSLEPSPDKMAGKGKSIWSSACRSRRLRKGSSPLILGGYFWTLSALTYCGYKCTFLPGLGQLLSDQDLTENPAQPSLVCPRELCPALDQNHPSPGSCLLPSSWWQPKGPYGSQPPVAGLTPVILLLHSWWLFQSMTCSAGCLWGHLCCHTPSDLLSCIH